LVGVSIHPIVNHIPIWIFYVYACLYLYLDYPKLDFISVVMTSFLFYHIIPAFGDLAVPICLSCNLIAYFGHPNLVWDIQSQIWLSKLVYVVLIYLNLVIPIQIWLSQIKSKHITLLYNTMHYRNCYCFYIILQCVVLEEKYYDYRLIQNPYWDVCRIRFSFFSPFFHVSLFPLSRRRRMLCPAVSRRPDNLRRARCTGTVPHAAPPRSACRLDPLDSGPCTSWRDSGSAASTTTTMLG